MSTWGDKRDAMFNAWREGDANEVELIIERGEVEAGRTFSSDAFKALGDQVMVFIGARVMRRWDDTNEPPTVLRAIVTVEVR